MTIPSWLIRLAALCAVLINMLAVLHFGVRPWFRRWGAHDAELQHSWPGDDVTVRPRLDSETTRAINIDAPAAEVWPWLAQLGQDRAGFYSYELLEDLVGCQMPRADRVYPEYQHWRVGDKLWMYPPDKLQGLGHAVLVRLAPGRSLVFATRQPGRSASDAYDGTWAFIVEPLGPQSTRLVVRGRAEGGRAVWGKLFDQVVFEPIHFMMERKMMEEIKARAEGSSSSRAFDNAQLASFVAALLLVIISAVLVFRRSDWGEPLSGFLLGCMLLQLLPFVQPSPALGLGLVAIASATLWLPGLMRRRRASSPDRGHVVPSAS